MTVIIVGGNGRIGSSFIEHILAQGGEVINIDIIHVVKHQNCDLYTSVTGFISDPVVREQIVTNIVKSRMKTVSGIVFLGRTLISNGPTLSPSREEAYRGLDLLIDSTLLIDTLLEYDLLAKTSIIHFSSTNAFQVSHQSVLYHSLKGATISASKALAQKLAHLNIRSNVVVLGLVSDRTNLEKQRLSIQKFSVPLTSGPPTLDDINNTLDFLLSASSRSITGTIITLDSGMSIPDAYTVASKCIQALN